MKRVPLWIWAGLAIVILCIVIVYTRDTREGFQFKTLNVPYTKEVFLVGAVGTYATPAYGNGVLYQDAATVCQKYGATLATLPQLKLALDASANWCKVGGWIAGDTSHLYYPEIACNDDTNPCDDQPDGTVSTRTRCVRKIPLPPSQKGFAICYGTKPAYGSDSDVQDFNDSNYSILDTQAVQETMTGGTNQADLLPYSFTASQALWGLEQPEIRFNTNDRRGKTARQYLKENLNTVNTTIRNTVDPNTLSNEDLAAWAQAKMKSCTAIGEVRGKIVENLTALRQVIATVEGRVKGTFDAKQENMDLQRQVAYICKNFTPEQSPACARMAGIDFDIFYRAGTGNTGLDSKVLSDLEDLNYQLRFQECFIQRALLKIQILSDTLMCPAPDAATAAVLGDYKTSPTTYYPETCEDLSKNAEWAALTGDNDKRFTIKKNIGYVSGEALRYAFEEISPFFNYPGYESLFTGILEQLSILIRIPSLNDYSNSDELFKTFPTRSQGLASLLRTFFTS